MTLPVPAPGPTLSRLKPLFLNLGSTELFGRSAASRPQTASIPAFGVPGVKKTLMTPRSPATAKAPGWRSELRVSVRIVVLVVSTVLSFRHVDYLSEMGQPELCRWTVRNLVRTVSGETGFLNSFPHSLVKILMKIEYLIRPRNVSYLA